MGQYLDRTHNQRGMPTDYHNRVDLDTSLKERGMDGFYGRSEKALEQKELHRFIIKRARNVGEEKAKREAISGKMFDKKDMSKF